MQAPEQSPQKIGKVMIYAAWLLVLGLLTISFGVWEKNQHNPNSDPASFRTADNIIEVQLDSNRYNHYVVDGTINGHRVTFLLDTGATHVAIPAHLAEKLNLQKGYRHQVMTANGIAEAFGTKINTLTIGDILLRDIRASINPSMATDEILLGMSALKQIEFTQRGDQLTLRQYIQ